MATHEITHGSTGNYIEATCTAADGTTPDFSSGTFQIEVFRKGKPTSLVLDGTPTATSPAATSGKIRYTFVSGDWDTIPNRNEEYHVKFWHVDGGVSTAYPGVGYDTLEVTADPSGTPVDAGNVDYVTQAEFDAAFFDTTQIVGASEDMPGPLYLYLIGDSHSADEDFRRPFLDQLRRTGDVIMLGPELIENAATNSWAPNYRSKFDLPDPRHGAYSGRTTAQIEAALVSSDVTTAQAIAMICPGTNDIAAGDSSSTVQTSIASLLDAIRALDASVPIFIAESPPFVQEHPGQTDSQHATREAVRAAVHAAMPTLVSTYTGVTYLPVGYTDGDGEIDGIHLRERGRMRVAKVLADEINRRFPEREGVLWPPTFRYRENDPFSSGFTAAANYWETTSDAFRPAPGERFVWGFDVKITDLQAAGVSTIMSYGPYASSDHCMIGHSNLGDLRVYLASAGPSLTVQPPTLLNNWRRVVLWGDPVNGLLAIFVDGQIRGYARSVTSWTIGSGKAARLGDNANGAITGMVGYMNHAFAGHGDDVPEWPEIRRQVEAWYWHNIPIDIPAGPDGLHFELDESSYAAGVYPNNGLSTTPMTTASSPTVTAYATAGAKPWDEESA
jgi:lysophospholipase L1-like esterase